LILTFSINIELYLEIILEIQVKDCFISQAFILSKSIKDAFSSFRKEKIFQASSKD
jgi:hypothetical protein